ncbi:hypothetical protein ARMSODRAFT_979129 [Armillaria solidipes]|uniref:Uncharacterized protein n=1 Tax=Armillaria solidipes TaxID=1076256 RepID=A0A2H3B030_9AGAR|nr:hypothetical protein ARMSODRAFT_979129 [Armillaria solidipes]
MSTNQSDQPSRHSVRKGMMPKYRCSSLSGAYNEDPERRRELSRICAIIEPQSLSGHVALRGSDEANIQRPHRAQDRVGYSRGSAAWMMLMMDEEEAFGSQRARAGPRAMRSHLFLGRDARCLRDLTLNQEADDSEQEGAITTLPQASPI